MQPPEGQPQPPQQSYFPPPYQQYGPPPYQQPPMYQPPPKKKRRRWPFVLLAILLLLCAIVGIAVATSSKSTNTGSVVSTTSTTSASTTAPTSAPSGQHFKVGQVVKVGDTWQVTVNSVKTSAGEQFLTPAAGHRYLIVDVTLKNLSSEEQNVSSALNFTLQDATGQKYNETILTGETPPDGKVEAGSLLRGQLPYEVPTAQKAFMFSFESDIISSGQTTWDITV